MYCWWYTQITCRTTGKWEAFPWSHPSWTRGTSWLSLQRFLSSHFSPYQLEQPKYPFSYWSNLFQRVEGRSKSRRDHLDPVIDTLRLLWTTTTRKRNKKKKKKSTTRMMMRWERKKEEALRSVLFFPPTCFFRLLFSPFHSLYVYSLLLVRREWYLFCLAPFNWHFLSYFPLNNILSFLASKFNLLILLSGSLPKDASFPRIVLLGNSLPSCL